MDVAHLHTLLDEQHQSYLPLLQVPAAAVLLAVVALLGVPAASAARAPKQQLSDLWGVYGEKWSPRGPIMDFSFAGERAFRGWPGCHALLEPSLSGSQKSLRRRRAAACAPCAAGYRQASVPLPEPPATVSVEDFREKGMSDTKMLQAALKWAHEQPVTGGEAALRAAWLVLAVAGWRRHVRAICSGARPQERAPAMHQSLLESALPALPAFLPCACLQSIWFWKCPRADTL